MWLGTTVEDQRRADERWPHLTSIPARVRFISAEPLLGPLDLTQWIDKIDWVITGGESGRGARPSTPSWFMSLERQGRDAAIAFFFKQWGNWAPSRGSLQANKRLEEAADGTTMLRTSKKEAGRILRARVWNAFPTSIMTRPKQ